MATEQVPAMAIGDGQGVAIDTVAGFELALEIRRPYLMGARIEVVGLPG